MFQGYEFFGRDIADYLQVAPRGLEILADGEYVAAGLAQIVKKAGEFLGRFPEPDHNAAFGHPAGGNGLAPPEKLQAASIIGLGSDGRIEACHGFEVMVEHIRLGGQNRGQGLGIALEVGDQHFDQDLRILVPV